jgi:hypothetical protein
MPGYFVMLELGMGKRLRSNTAIAKTEASDVPNPRGFAYPRPRRDRVSQLGNTPMSRGMRLDSAKSLSRAAGHGLEVDPAEWLQTVRLPDLTGLQLTLPICRGVKTVATCLPVF